MAGSSEGRVPRPGRRRLAEQRYTLMLVPDGGRGGVRQATFTLKQARRALMASSGVLLAGVALALMGIVGLPTGLRARALEDENLALRARLHEIDRTLDQAEKVLRRLRLYDAELNIPSMGPLEPDEIAARDSGAIVELYLDEPMDDHGSALEEEGTDALASRVEGRSRRLLELLEQSEPELSELVEDAAGERARQSAMPSLWPLVGGELTSTYGWRRSPFTHRWKFHSGVDIAGPLGLKIRSPAAGEVTLARWNSGYGRMVEVDHGYGVTSRFAHNSRVFVREGMKVRKGQVIATVGSTGQSTGPHLHYEIEIDGETVDPLQYLQVPEE